MIQCVNVLCVASTRRSCFTFRIDLFVCVKLEREANVCVCVYVYDSMTT